MSGKSKEEIAFELVAKLKGVGVWGENNQEAILDMYAQCLEAASGLRSVDGNVPSALRLKDSPPAPKPKAAPQQASILPQAARPAHPAQNQVPPAFQQAPLQTAAPQQNAQPRQQVAQPTYQQQVQPR